MARWYLRRDLDSLLRLSGDLARVSFQDVESISLHFSRNWIIETRHVNERTYAISSRLFAAVCWSKNKKNLKLRACTDRKEFEKKNPIIPSQGERETVVVPTIHLRIEQVGCWAAFTVVTVHLAAVISPKNFFKQTQEHSSKHTLNYYYEMRVNNFLTMFVFSFCSTRPKQWT